MRLGGIVRAGAGGKARYGEACGGRALGACLPALAALSCTDEWKWQPGAAGCEGAAWDLMNW